MIVKIDTKEKFNVITPQVTQLSANMTVEMSNLLLTYLQKDIPHIILKLTAILDLEEEVANLLVEVQQQFYENNCSFVICDLQTSVSKKLDELEILELLNVTPTESEAWDIVQMEEIERELLGGE
jgi:anti-anti-sigma regulatory factor